MTLGTFLGGSWASLGIGSGLILFLGIWAFERGHIPINKHIIYSVLGVLAVMVLLDTQSTSPNVSWHILLQEVTIMIPLALLFSPRVIAHIDTPNFFPVVSAAAAMGAFAYGLEFEAGFPILHAMKGMTASVTEYNRGASYLAVFSFPLMGYLWIKGLRWQAVTFTALMLIPVMFTESRATRLAFFLGLAITISAHILPNLTRRGLIGLLTLLITFPFIITTAYIQHPQWVADLPPSWHHRVEIWDYMSYRIFEKPWLGWGLGSSHLLPYALPHGLTYEYVKQAASHPHNAAIQLWVELGIVGLAMSAIIAVTLLQKAARFASPVIPFALGTWAAALCISSVAYSFWDDSLFSLFSMTMVALIILSKQTKEIQNGTTA
ncbi:MAG: O-antigen ligase family protein [Alphaproteobacteria bacterium]|nr:O-antigen ligase family protein [Alphaproteobacteria bacterium]